MSIGNWDDAMDDMRDDIGIYVDANAKLEEELRLLGVEVPPFDFKEPPPVDQSDFMNSSCSNKMNELAQYQRRNKVLLELLAEARAK